MEQKVNAMTAAHALKEWKYAKQQAAIRRDSTFTEVTMAYKNLCNHRLQELWNENEITTDHGGQIRLSLAKYDPKELQALLEWHNSK